MAASTGRASVGRHADDRGATLALWGAIAVGVVIRLLVARGQGFLTDVGTFMAWATRMAEVGPGRFYEPGYFSDYPPAFLYVLWVVGAIFHGGEALRLVVKALSIPADIAIAIVLFRLVRPYAGAMAGAAAAAMWMLQPGPIFAGPFWGQVDSWGTLPFLLALIAAGRGRWAWAGALAAVAAMAKPQFGLVAIVVSAGALIELIRSGRPGPLVRTGATGLVTAVAIAVPFGLTPGAFVDLVKSASETYPYTSLFAFNIWSIVGDFWQPDARYVVLGAALLVVGILGSIATLWRRRDVAMFLVAGALATCAFYFLPTRAHERYLLPAFALLAPFAVTRRRILMPYTLLALSFFASLYFAFTRYPQNGLTSPPLLESTLFSRSGQIALALVMIGATGLLVWRLVRGEARLVPEEVVPAPGSALAAAPGWRLPTGLGRGHAPTRRDLALALLVALAVVATRGFRLDQPRDMYFDEVYHPRTAFELLAQREPYEWTHPHLAKEIMALGILAFGGDRVEAREAAPRGVTAFAVSNEGLRAYGFADGRIELRERDGRVARELSLAPRRVVAVAVDGTSLFALTDAFVGEFDLLSPDPKAGLKVHALAEPGPTAFAVARGRAVVGTAHGLEIHGRSSDRPLTLPIATAALTARPDSSDVFVADAAGTIHVVDSQAAQETGTMSGGGRPVALAYARGPERLFAARADAAAVDWYEPPRTDESGRREGVYGGMVALSNGRTGELRGPVSALALVPRTQFLYALVDEKIVVIETHGASPYAAIPVSGTMLGVDGTGDELVVAADGSVERIPTGRHAFAWRLPGVLSAALLAFFLVLLARRLFASRLVPAFAGLAVVLDGAMFAQARIGMNDVYVGTFIVAGWYFVVAAHAPRRSAAFDLVVAGVFFGLAAASKWAAFYALAGLALYAVVATAWAWGQGRPGSGGPFDLLAARTWGRWWLRRAIDELIDRVPESLSRALRAGAQASNAVFLLVCFAVIPVVIYLASYLRWYGGPTIPFNWDLVELTKQMYWYHSGLTAPHPAGSPWWSWPLVLKPVYWYLGSPGAGQTAVIYDAGNVVLFWGGLVALVWGTVAAIRARSLALGMLVFALLTQYVAWVPITRVLFFYHFFTALPFYLAILAAALAALWESGRRQLVAAYLALAAAAFVFFYPFLSGQPVPADQATVFYILPTWQYDCQFYPSFRCESAFRAEIPLQQVAGRIAVAAGVALLAVAAAAALLDERATARLRSWAGRIGPRRPATE